MHTGLKSRGRGVAQFFAKIPVEGGGAGGSRGGGGHKALGKIARGRSSYFVFYCIFINKSFEICLGGSYKNPKTSVKNLRGRKEKYILILICGPFV